MFVFSSSNAIHPFCFVVLNKNNIIPSLTESRNMQVLIHSINYKFGHLSFPIFILEACDRHRIGVCRIDDYFFSCLQKLSCTAMKLFKNLPVVVLVIYVSKHLLPQLI
ncbi:Uncharacterised protein [Mycobacterium tuberculosis]|nr:Uncharacterised protein [Mycobacterium tuberculosis]